MDKIKIAAPAGLQKLNCTTVARVVSASLTDSKFGGKQVKLEWVTQRGNRFFSYVTPTSPGQIRLYVTNHILVYTDSSEQFLEVAEEQPWLTVTLRDSKITALASYTEM